jgi:hypothetical protein
MFYSALTFAVILNVLFISAVHRPKVGIPFYLILGFGISLLSVVLFINYIALGILIGFMYTINPRFRLIAPIVGVLATILVFAPIGIRHVLQTQPKIQHLREIYPMESLESRIPDQKSLSPLDPDLSILVEEELWAFDRALNNTNDHSRRSWLRKLHSNHVSRFSNAPGFGVGRLRPLGIDLDREEHRFPREVPDWINSDASVEELIGSEEWQRPSNTADYWHLHFISLLDFLNLDRMGYVESRRQVAGFASHQFQDVPKPLEPWSLRSLQLVGLLRHETPLVYISERLPQMDKLAGVPTRKLTTFEQSAFEKLQRGESLIAEVAGKRARMLGAIRSVDQCLKCHAGNRGDLLGAFSYSLDQKTAGK